MSTTSPGLPTERRPGGLAGALAVGALGLALLPLQASAHGPTVLLSYSGATPRVLAIEAGMTVHFKNANSSPLVCTVVAKDGSFESPPLERAGGWHHTFEEPGVYEFQLRERGNVSGTIVVGEP